MMLARACALAAAFFMMVSPMQAQVLRFSDLDGWAADDHQAALAVFRETCGQLTDADWAPLCRLAKENPEARGFFERFFRPVLIGAPPALFTGYYEPELRGSPVRTAKFAHPVYGKPPELVPGEVWHSREQIERQGLLRGRGLEIAWLQDPVEAFFLQIQGSGRIAMEDGRVIRVGFAAKNGHPYRSVGQELARRGVYKPSQVSAAVIGNWVRRNPEEGAALLLHNPSFVFFRQLDDLPADRGPIGAMHRPVVAMRSIAVDPEFTQLGAPVWVEKDGANPLRRLMIAQDTGSAIKGAQRADIFYGTGAAAGDIAGRIKDGGRMIVLLPAGRAHAMLSGG